MPPPETYKSEIGSQSTTCQVQAGAHVSNIDDAIKLGPLFEFPEATADHQCRQVDNSNHYKYGATRVSVLSILCGYDENCFVVDVGQDRALRTRNSARQYYVQWVWFTTLLAAVRNGIRFHRTGVTYCNPASTTAAVAILIAAVCCCRGWWCCGCWCYRCYCWHLFLLLMLLASFFISQQMWQKKPFFCDASLPSLAGQYTLDDVQAAVDADFVEVSRPPPPISPTSPLHFQKPYNVQPAVDA